MWGQVGEEEDAREGKAEEQGRWGDSKNRKCWGEKGMGTEGESLGRVSGVL